MGSGLFKLDLTAVEQALLKAGELALENGRGETTAVLRKPDGTIARHVKLLRADGESSAVWAAPVMAVVATGAWYFSRSILTRRRLDRQIEELNATIEALIAERDDQQPSPRATGNGPSSEDIAEVDPIDAKIIDLERARSTLEQKRSQLPVRRSTAPQAGILERLTP